MDVVSTRTSAHHATFRHALTANLTPDGGLWIPARLLPFANLDALLEMPLAERCAEILKRVIGDEFSHADLDALAHDAFDFPLPLTQIDEQTYALELFHGPTLAFKDFGARLLARLLRLHDADTTSATGYPGRTPDIALQKVIIEAATQKIYRINQDKKTIK